MEALLSILILVPTFAVLAMGVLLLVGTAVVFTIASVDGIIVGLRHRLHMSPRRLDTGFGTPALHH